MEYLAQPTPHLVLATGITLTLDVRLASPGYRAWVARLIDHPDPDLWTDRRWPDDHLVYGDGQIWYCQQWRAESHTCLDFRIPLSAGDLTAYLECLRALPTRPDTLHARGGLSLVGRGDWLSVSEGQIVDVGRGVEYLRLQMTKVEVPLPEVGVLHLLSVRLRQDNTPLRARTAIVTDIGSHDLTPPQYQAPAVWMLSPMYRDRLFGVQTGHLVTEMQHTLCDDSRWTLWSRPRDDLWQKWHHYVRDGEEIRELGEEESLPLLETVILVPGMIRRFGATGLPPTVLLPGRYWRGHVPEGLERYCEEEEYRVTAIRVFRRSPAKRPVH